MNLECARLILTFLAFKINMPERLKKYKILHSLLRRNFLFLNNTFDCHELLRQVNFKVLAFNQKIILCMF